MNRPSDMTAGTGWPHEVGNPPFLSVSCEGISGRPHCELGTPVQNGATGQTEGVFAKWAWDGQRLRATVDPLGFFSLFYWQGKGRVILSPSILQLIAQGADAQPDHRALGVFFRLGLFLNEDTPFRDIKVLPPGGVLEWANGQLSVQSNAYDVAEDRISREAAIEGMIDLPRDSLRILTDAWNGPTVLPLSGGRDSRHILLGLKHIGRPPEACVTFQAPAITLNSEALAARAVCERQEVPHHILAQPRAVSRDILRCLALTGLCSDEHQQMMPMHDYLAGGNWAALDGIAGDILTNPDTDAEAQYRRAQAGDFRAMAQAMIDGHAGVLSRQGHSGGPGAVFTPDTEEEATQYIADTIARHADAPDPYQAFWFWHRTRREIGFVPSALFGSANAVLCPYLDSRFVRFCLSLPYEVTRDRRLHDLAIARGYPEAADVAYGDSFSDAPPPRHRLRSKLARAVEGASTLLALSPDHPVSEVSNYLKGSPDLNRRPAQVLQLYNLVRTGIDASTARHVMQLAGKFARDAGQSHVSETYHPGGQA